MAGRGGDEEGFLSPRAAASGLLLLRKKERVVFRYKKRPRHLCLLPSVQLPASQAQPHQAAAHSSTVQSSRTSHGSRRRRHHPAPRLGARRRRFRGHPSPGAGGGLPGGVPGPQRLPRLRAARQQHGAAGQDLLRGGEDRRQQPRHRRLPLRRHSLQTGAAAGQHDPGARPPRRLRRIQRSLQQVPRYAGWCSY